MRADVEAASEAFNLGPVFKRYEPKRESNQQGVKIHRWNEGVDW